MKKLLLILFVNSIALSAISQGKLLTMEDAMVNNRTILAPENLRQLQFIYGTDDYVYLKKVNDKDVWLRGNFKNNESTFLTLEQLNQKLRLASADTLSAMPAIRFDQSADWLLTVNGNRIALNPTTGKSRTLINKSI